MMGYTKWTIVGRQLALLVMATFAFVACSDSTTPRIPSALAVTSGNDQTVLVNAVAASPLVVTVLDQNGTPLSGVVVTWTITSGEGSLSTASVVSDVNGLASVSYTAGSDPGAVGISAAVGSVSAATFTIEIMADAAS
jgi:hypothetical protein